MIDFPICHADVPADNIMYMSEGDSGRSMAFGRQRGKRDARIDAGELVGEVPGFRDRPEEHVGDGPEDGEREEAEDHRPDHGRESAPGGHAGLPPSRIPWRRYTQAMTAVIA